MTSTAMTGNQLVCAVLEQLGVQHAFGLPGTQNVPLFEALRRSRSGPWSPPTNSPRRSWPGAYSRARWSHRACS